MREDLAVLATPSKTRRHVGLALGFMALSAGALQAEVLTGILYSIHHGQGRNPAGQVRLAAANRVHELEYVPRAVHFRHKVCYEIGAIWLTTVRTADGSRYVYRVTCNGSTDQSTHLAWQVVRDYLKGLAGTMAASHPFSSRWRSLPESEMFESNMKELGFEMYRYFGEDGRCLDALDIEPFKRARFGAGECGLRANGVLAFELLWNPQATKWEIDSVEFESK